METISHRLARRYSQLLLPVAAGMSKTEAYKNAVLRGIFPEAEPIIPGTAEDTFKQVETAVGSVGIWTLVKREDFVLAVQALAYRCEPKPVPDAVGAQYIGGLIDWEKIRCHKERYLSEGGQNWSQEFRRFTGDKRNYTDSLILLSTGFYSNIPPETVGLGAQEWKQKSMVIRKYHELTHFVYRKAYPGDVDVIRDEVLADCVGIQAAFGSYRRELAECFLGIQDGRVLPDARIRHYVPNSDLPAAVRQALFWVEIFSGVMEQQRLVPSSRGFL